MGVVVVVLVSWLVLALLLGLLVGAAIHRADQMQYPERDGEERAWWKPSAPTRRAAEPTRDDEVREDRRAA